MLFRSSASTSLLTPEASPPGQPVRLGLVMAPFSSSRTCPRRTPSALQPPSSVEHIIRLMLRSATSFLLRTSSRPAASLILNRTKTTGQFGVLSGAPKDELERKVFVFRPAKSAGQHASAAVPSYPWKLSFEKKDRWVNPLMGWTSSSDSLAGQTPGNMNFESKDAAIAFAERNG